MKEAILARHAQFILHGLIKMPYISVLSKMYTFTLMEEVCNIDVLQYR